MEEDMFDRQLFEADPRTLTGADFKRWAAQRNAAYERQRATVRATIHVELDRRVQDAKGQQR